MVNDLDKIDSLSKLHESYSKILPNHVGLILDGNRRWIRRQGIKDTLKGHQEGYRTLRKILDALFDVKIRYLSIYALSSENVRKRSKKEVSYLFNLLLQSVEEVIQDTRIHENQVQVKIIGRIKELPENIQKEIQKVNDITEKYHNYFINVCINYDGQEEIIDAVKNIITLGLTPENITKETIKQNLYTKEFPELDYLIRTGMEDGARISGFLLWDASYSEFRFRKELWPDYNEEMLLEDLKEYVKRNRRKGA
ncbi:MAG: polyprenyl diphosphate synthase [Promethearchaeota archaeon]